MDEIWKDITDIRGYQISNFGNIRSVDRVVNHSNKIDIWRLANAKEIELLGSSNFVTIKDED